jgi:hypothetical protein
MVRVRYCALSSVIIILAPLLGIKYNTIRQRLWEWCYDAKDKRGKKRKDLKVESCFPALLSWIISWWEGKQVALALDATTLKDIFIMPDSKCCVSWREPFR